MATAGGYGVRQGKLIHSLGMGLAESGVRGANTVRAAKSPCHAWPNPSGCSFSLRQSATVPERIHMFNDDELASIIARYVFNHEASLLLPATSFPNV